MPVDDFLKRWIMSRTSKVVEHTIWWSSESVLALIDWKLWYSWENSQLECHMWESILWELYFFDEKLLPEDEESRIELVIEKMRVTIQERKSWVEKRRVTVSRHLNT